MSVPALAIVPAPSESASELRSPEDVELRSWIRRQLRWEDRLGELREDAEDGAQEQTSDSAS